MYTNCSHSLTARSSPLMCKPFMLFMALLLFKTAFAMESGSQAEYNPILNPDELSSWITSSKVYTSDPGWNKKIRIYAPNLKRVTAKLLKSDSCYPPDEKSDSSHYKKTIFFKRASPETHLVCKKNLITWDDSKKNYRFIFIA